MRDHGIEKIIKGYRNDKDLEYEKKMAEWNLYHGGYETEFILANPKSREISSTLARQIISEGGDLTDVLPKKVIEFINKR